MTPMSPALTEMVARPRVTEMRQTATRRSHGTRWPESHGARRTPTPPAATRWAGPARSRRAIGWLLISVGLRLALPRPGAWSP